MKKTKYVIFTDLDGTLLDHNNYSFKKAQDALKLIKDNNVPLIFCSSKTYDEIELFREKMKNNDPFVVENGSAIFIPINYFNFHFNYTKILSNYKVIEIGCGYEKVIEILKYISKKYKIKFKGFHNLSLKEITFYSNLNYQQVKLAKKRNYSIPLLLDEKKKNIIKSEIKKHDLQLLKGGRFYNLISINSDKGKSITLLKNLFLKKYKYIKTVSTGDSLNDVAMLKKVDIPVLVKKINGNYEKMKVKNLQYADGIGPEGWNGFILKLLKFKGGKNG